MGGSMSMCSTITLAVLAVFQGAFAEEPAAIEGDPWVRHAIDNTSDGADGARLCDANHDGLLDLVTPWEEGGVIRLYLHPGFERVRAIWPRVNVGAVGSPEDALLADLDSDGAMDVTSAAEGTTRVLSVHWAPTNPTDFMTSDAWTTTPVPASQGVQWMFQVAAQVDGVNGLDVIAGGKNDGATIGWFQLPANPRDTTQWTWRSLRGAGWIMSIRLVDMNGDGREDILFSDRKGEERGVWWLEKPDSSDVATPWPVHAIGGRDHEVMFLDHGDIDDDGRADIAVATRDGGIVLLFQTNQNASAWRQEELPMPLNTGTGKSVAIGDVDEDGVQDLVVSCEMAKDKHGVFVLKRKASGWRAYAVSGLEGTKFDLVTLHDFDGDGDLDVLTCEEAENLGIIWYENPRRSPGREDHTH